MLFDHIGMTISSNRTESPTPKGLARIMDEDNHLSDIRSAALGGDVSHKLTAESVPALYKCFDADGVMACINFTANTLPVNFQAKVIEMQTLADQFGAVGGEPNKMHLVLFFKAKSSGEEAGWDATSTATASLGGWDDDERLQRRLGGDGERGWDSRRRWRRQTLGGLKETATALAKVTRLDYWRRLQRRHQTLERQRRDGDTVNEEQQN
nr:hypothetical protein Iba_chr06dCG8720 [Ipomoea batatas]